MVKNKLWLDAALWLVAIALMITVTCEVIYQFR